MKSVLVIGGTRGIGRATLEVFLEKGYNVAFTYKESGTQASSLEKELQKRFPQLQIRKYQLNVIDEQQVDSVCEKVIADFGTLHALVCNAGIAKGGLLASHSTEVWNEVLQTNLTGTFFVCRALITHFLLNRQGKIVLLSSINRNGAKGLCAYSASKAALVGFGQSIAKEYGAKGITCNIVSPGFIDTDLTTGAENHPSGQFFLTHSPKKRAGSVAEVASAISYLCSDEASFINGSELRVDGGLNWMP